MSRTSATSRSSPTTTEEPHLKSLQKSADRERLKSSSRNGLSHDLIIEMLTDGAQNTGERPVNFGKLSKMLGVSSGDLAGGYFWSLPLQSRFYKLRFPDRLISHMRAFLTHDRRVAGYNRATIRDALPMLEWAWLNVQLLREGTDR